MHIDPRPNPNIVPEARPISWLDPVAAQIDLSAYSLGDRAFADIMTSRRSVRTIRPAPIEQVAFVVRETMRTYFVGLDTKHGRKLKTVLSAGALHPVKALITKGSGRPLYYDDDQDSFLSLGIRDERSWLSFQDECREVLPHVDGCLVALIADNRDISRLYSNHQSLLWRDAGAVIQGMAFVAEAVGLAMCPMGILGGDAISALLDPTDDFLAVGIVAIGLSDTFQNAS
ncbi:nitroreductase family protein [Neorhizobium galegae]|uniref:nitroreductase family protein n=1 Tax=Neorhizobium galegae TaxID=399 RepID=UPI00210343D3|nr:nitroreductase family protein [Neorhizobium galegae]MCQ1779400.1 nitroreductase family protein [Neorhizobium galegae]MCQ1795560.1 nitroreductase family protein [Neorhizobium galegae]